MQLKKINKKLLNIKIEPGTISANQQKKKIRKLMLKSLKNFSFYERYLPMGFGTAIAYMQSNGNPFKDHIIG